MTRLGCSFTRLGRTDPRDNSVALSLILWAESTNNWAGSAGPRSSSSFIFTIWAELIHPRHHVIPLQVPPQSPQRHAIGSRQNQQVLCQSWEPTCSDWHMMYGICQWHL